MIELRILGPPDLRRMVGERGAALHLQPKRLALLAYLALASSASGCRRDTLLALFWPDLDEAHARNALSQAIHRLRRTLGPDVLLSRGTEELRLSPDRFRCDAVVFEQALARHDLIDALDVYRGPLLDGLHLEGVANFEHWLEVERERLRCRAGEAAAALAGRHEAEGNLAGAVLWLRRRLALEPGDEATARRLMETLHRLGDRVGALRAYEAFVRRLAQAFDLLPSAETQKLAARLRTPQETRVTPDVAAVPSVAVLPFANLSNDPEQEYFCDGMTEEIINVLAQIQGLRVAARTSVFAFKAQPLDVRTLGQQLGIDAVIEGSVRREGGQLRITAQLIEAATGYHLWSKRYDRPLHDVFAVQDEIARSVADTLRVELLQRRRTSVPTVDMEAHALYLEGLFHRRKRTPEGLKQACACFRKAVEGDPGYAQAHAALAFTYALGGWFLYDVFSPRQAYPLAREAADRALRLNDRLAEAHLAVAYLRNAFEWDSPGAEAAFQQALSLDPDHIGIIGNYAGYLVSRGRFDEAIAITERSVKLDPFWIMPRVGIGIWLLAARRYEEAIDRLSQTRQMEPQLFIPSLFLGDAYRFSGCLDEAYDTYRQVLDLIGRQPIILGRLGALYAVQHRPEAARRIIEELLGLAEERHVLPSIVANIYLALDDHAQALLWLEKAYQERDTTLTLLQVWPDYDSLRSEPRLRRLVKEVGLEQGGAEEGDDPT